MFKSSYNVEATTGTPSNKWSQTTICFHFNFELFSNFLRLVIFEYKAHAHTRTQARVCAWHAGLLVCVGMYVCERAIPWWATKLDGQFGACSCLVECTQSVLNIWHLASLISHHRLLGKCFASKAQCSQRDNHYTFIVMNDSHRD